MKKKVVTTVLSTVIALSLVSSAAAASNPVASNGISAKAVVSYNGLFKQHASELQVTKETPYKEVKLNDGNILFTSISISEPTTSSNSLSSKVNATNAQQTLTMTSSQGVKNIFGYTLYKLDYTTVWTYDFSTVVSSYSILQ